MNEKFKLNAKEIYEKEFHIDLKGYSVEEVDAFLDLIIRDYNTYDKLIEELGIHMQNYEADNKKLRNEINNLKSQLSLNTVKSENSSNVDNLDIIKRISNLEKEVFKNK